MPSKKARSKRNAKAKGKDVRPQPSGSKRPTGKPVNFLGVLPIELREHIWALALSPLLERPRYPDDRIERRPGHERFKAYTQLRLVNKQVSAEAERVFRLDIAPHIVFYCAHAPQLFSVRQRIESHPIMKDARFHLVTPRWPEKSDDILTCLETGCDDVATSDMEDLILTQLGVDEIWTVSPGFFRCLPEKGWGEAYSAPRMYSVGNEDVFGEGFVVRYDLLQASGCDAPIALPKSKGKHAAKKGKKRNKKDIDINLSQRRYMEVVFPPLENSLRLTNYGWDDTFVGDPEEEHGQAGCTVLEGKIMDVNFDEYDDAEARGHLEIQSYYASDDDHFCGYSDDDLDLDAYEYQYRGGSDEEFDFY